MELNFSVKIKSGKRTPPVVTVYSTAINTKSMWLPTGNVTNKEIADWMERYIQAALDTL